MKKIENIKLDIIRLEAADVMTASLFNEEGDGTKLAPTRYNFDNGSYMGETFDNDYDYSSHYE